MTTETALQALAAPKILERNYRQLTATEVLAILTAAVPAERAALVSAIRAKNENQIGVVLAGIVYRSLKASADAEAATLDFSTGLTLAQVELLFGPLE